jgi:hypothetical protein
MNYTRREIDKLTNPRNGEPEKSQALFTELLKKLINKQPLSIRESIAICDVLPILEGHNPKVLSTNPKDYDACRIPYFLKWHTYFYSDLNGNLPKFNHMGDEYDKEFVKEIAAYLEEESKNWSEVVENTDHKAPLLKIISKETRVQLKDLSRFQERTHPGTKLRAYQKKEVILFSKKAHYLVDEFYEEKSSLSEEIIIDGNCVQIGAIGYFHTLMRHYAQTSKEHNQDKDFHIDNLNYRYLPENIVTILKEFQKSENKGEFDKKHTMISIENKPYSMRFLRKQRTVDGGKLEDYFVFNTIYPISDNDELRLFNNEKRLNYPKFESAFPEKKYSSNSYETDRKLRF